MGQLFKKSIFVRGRYAKGGGGSGDNVQLTLCIEKSICESSLTCIGKKGREVYNTFTFATDHDKMRFTKIIKKIG